MWRPRAAQCGRSVDDRSPSRPSNRPISAASRAGFIICLRNRSGADLPGVMARFPGRGVRCETGSMFSDLRFSTHRVPVIGTRGMVASTQPLASEAGLRILRQGGNAADAAVAVAAALNVTEPYSTGVGGDACVLYYDRQAKRVECQIGYGRSAQDFTREAVSNAGFGTCRIPLHHPLGVTVPGAAQLWEDTLTHWGTQSLKEVVQSDNDSWVEARLQVLIPAIELCEHGFPVASVTAHNWARHVADLKGEGCSSLKSPVSGGAPAAGEWMKNLDLGQTFRTMSELGAQTGFYQGRIAEAIVSAVQKEVGVLALNDLATHSPSQPITPASTSYRGYTVWEVPPPSQGVVALAALNHLEVLLEEVEDRAWGSDEVLHAQIEAVRLAFFEALHSNADPMSCDVPLDKLICKKQAAEVRATHKLSRQASKLKSRIEGEQQPGVDQADTVYFCIVDREGIVPKGCGFALHNRGQGFCTMESHPNCIGPSKRPYHTIIPGMCTNADGDLFCAFGVMGGFMQPQGHLQVLSNLIDFKMNPQSALDAARFLVTDVNSAIGPRSVEQSKVSLEEGFSEEAIEKLKARGHAITYPSTDFFGRGQIILSDANGVLWGGSDARADGCAMGY